MSKLIAIDDGHGMETPGKRTPTLPGTKQFMHENEFNWNVAQKLKINLERCGFKTLMVAPTDADTPLSTRVDIADTEGANLFFSVHANALNGIFGKQEGVSVYHYPGSIEGKKCAEIILKHLLQGTPQKNRGVLSANFYVLRKSTMTAVLAEHAFMDNLREAKLLMSEAFRQECADEDAQGICEYFGVPWVPAARFHEVIGTTHVVKVNPMDLKAKLVKASGKFLAKTEKNLINCNLFNSDMSIIGWLISEGKVLNERREIGVSWAKQKGTLIVYRDGTVFAGVKFDADIVRELGKIWFCVQGFNLFPMDIKKEGFDPTTVGYSTARMMIGYNGKEVVIAYRPETDAARAVISMTNLGCKKAICLDSGLSANMVLDGKAIVTSDRVLPCIVTF